MAALYNDTFMENSTSLYDLLIGTSASMGNPYLVGNLILLGFFMVFLLYSYKQGFVEVLVADSLLTTVIAILLFYAGLVSSASVGFPFVMLVVSLVFLFISR